MQSHHNTGAHGAAAADEHKPTMGQKIGGAVQEMIGKATHNPGKVAEGEAKKQGLAGPPGGPQGYNEQLRHGERPHDPADNSVHQGLSGATGATTGTGLTGDHHSHPHTQTGDHTHSHGADNLGLTGNKAGTGSGNLSGREPGLQDGSVTGTGYGQGLMPGNKDSNTGNILPGHHNAGTHSSTGTHLPGTGHHETTTGSHIPGTGYTGHTGTTGSHLPGTHDNTGFTGGAAPEYGNHPQQTHGSGLATGGNHGIGGAGTGAGTGGGLAAAGQKIETALGRDPVHGQHGQHGTHTTGQGY